MNIDEAIDFMMLKHANQKRKHGAPYYTHPLAVSMLLKRKGFSEEYQIAGLFHDLIEDTDATYEEILRLSSPKVVQAVKLVTKESGYVMSEYMERISKNNMAKMVKLADRIHNLSEAHLASNNFAKRYIDETKTWFIKLAEGSVFEEDLNGVISRLEENLCSRER